jgi:hypothetical protein
MITVPNFNILDQLPSQPIEGELAQTEDTNTCYKYVNGKWEEIEKPEATQSISEYELTRMAVTSLPTAEESQFVEVLHDFFDSNKETKYFAMLCRDINYYTIFARGTGDADIVTEVCECLTGLGAIKLVGITEDKSAIEFWFTSEYEPISYCGYIFDYTEGVVLCK